ncbi:hypothetical protein PR048_006551 [Dryococelus australis]|uniref:Mutator-like transposase domain-containing protein n=1 Tax=Dryococelus australis TaxID=614101 RepID=A0ABQ9ICL1_9NEOP|nr:hypothetical protein PR048_006551 [Dryococelus australis]
MKQIVASQPYGPNFLITKIECKNHVMRNYDRRLREIATMTKNATGSLRLRVAVTSAIRHRSADDLPLQQRIDELAKHIHISPCHVFGDHSHCSERGYFCKGPKEGGVCLVNILKEVDSHYGDVNAVNKMSKAQFKKKKEKFKDQLCLTEYERTSHFGKICKMKSSTPKAKTVISIIYRSFQENKGIRYGLEKEPIAIEQLSKELGFWFAASATVASPTAGALGAETYTNTIQGYFEHAMMSKEVSKLLEEFEQQVWQQLRELQDRLASVVQERPKSTNSEDIPRMQEEVATFSVDVQKQLDNIRKELQAVSDSVLRQDERIDELEQYSRRNCLLFHGVAEKNRQPNRSAAQAVKEGRRPIIVKFVSCQFRSMVFHAKRALKNMPLVITELLTADRQRLLKSAKERFGPRSCWTQDGRIFVLHTNRRSYLSSMRELVNIQ